MHRAHRSMSTFHDLGQLLLIPIGQTHLMDIPPTQCLDAFRLHQLESCILQDVLQEALIWATACQL